MDKYTKLQKIGQGSFGCAYLCVKKQDPLGRKFVIKEIRMDPRDQQTALREAKLLAALDHPNIIGCRESFLAGPNVLCIVTEFADGGDLRKQLTDRSTRRSPYKENELLDLFLQCCLALKHLHDRKIIHRDIKPENVFLTSSLVVKLGDFGVATVLSHTLACAQTLTGTPYYTSPEICLGKKYNSKTDVWSLGCVLYELATFAHAFNGRSQRQLFENIVGGSFAPIHTSSLGYSARLVALVSEMLQKNPRDRPSVNQLIRRPVLMERIQSFLSQRGVADALNHTVLHGQHIFQRQPQARGIQDTSPGRNNITKPTPSPMYNRDPSRAPPSSAGNRPAVSPAPARVRAVQYEPPSSRKRPEAAAAAGRARVGSGVSGGARGGLRRNSLKASKKKLVRKLVSPAKKQQQPKPLELPLPPPPPPPAAKSPSPALRDMQQRLLQRKKEAVARAREDAAIKRNRSPADKPRANHPVAPTPTPPKLQPKPQSSSSPSANNVSDRVSAFNAQWQAQRKQILHNLAPALVPPPPPPVSVVPVKKPLAAEKKQGDASPVAPPRAPLMATGVVLKRGKKAASASALAAAKQREAMRRDIQAKKRAVAQQQQQRRPSGATPLDDPVILVQNLPDYKPSKAAVPAMERPPTPPDKLQPKQEEDEETGEDEEADEEEDVDTPDSTVAEQANLEFQRMLLQLQSVVGEPDPAEEDEEEDEEEEAEEDQGKGASRDGLSVTPVCSLDDKDSELRSTMTLPPPPFDAADKPTCSVVLTHAMLEDAGFKAALRARLRGDENAQQQLSLAQAETLAWLSQYIRELR